MLRRASFVLAFLTACGSAPKPAARVKQVALEQPVETPSSVVTVKEEPKVEPWHPAEGGGDAPVPYVRDERSSRLDALAPKGRAREAWRTPLALGDAPAIHAAFVLSAGNRVAVVGAEAWVLFDTKGVRIAGHEMDTPAIRFDRASGALIPDDVRSADLPADAKIAAKSGLAVLVKNGSVSVGERAIEGKFEALDVAIDESSLASVFIKQGDDLSLWTIPISGNAAIGRHKLGKKRTAVGPPILGKTVRVVVLDSGIVAYALDGKKLWERKGVPTGGASITGDDQVLLADQGKVILLDKKGKATDLWSGPDLVFSTPPIINGEGLLLVASGQFVHAFTFS